jgi:hypothetical protein
MINKVWIIYRKENMDHVEIYDDKVYLKKETAEKDAKELNKGNYYKYYVDYLSVDND